MVLKNARLWKKRTNQNQAFKRTDKFKILVKLIESVGIMSEEGNGEH